MNGKLTLIKYVSVHRRGKINFTFKLTQKDERKNEGNEQTNEWTKKKYYIMMFSVES